MSLIVEDGTGLSTANAYISVAEADNFFIDSTIKWTGTTTAKEHAIVRATRTIDIIGGSNFIGKRLTSTQSLEWPRQEAYLNGEELTGLPIYLKRAVCEAALQELIKEGSTLPNTTQKVKTERVEGVVQVTYTDDSYQGTTFRAIHGWLDWLLRGSGLRVVRV